MHRRTQEVQDPMALTAALYQYRRCKQNEISRSTHTYRKTEHKYNTIKARTDIQVKHNIYIFIHQKMIATKQVRKNEKLDSGHNIEHNSNVGHMPT